MFIYIYKLILNGAGKKIFNIVVGMKYRQYNLTIPNRVAFG
jgi:hypothetical protein